MALLAYRHGLRPIELVTLRRDAIDFAHGQIHIGRAKNGSPSVHPLSGVELRALRRLRRDQELSSSESFRYQSLRVTVSTRIRARLG
jgi:integrase